MINKEKAKKIAKEQPLYWDMLSSIAAEEAKWLRSSSKVELTENAMNRFKKLHEGLIRHNIINNISSVSGLLEDLEVITKIS